VGSVEGVGETVSFSSLSVGSGGKLNVELWRVERPGTFTIYTLFTNFNFQGQLLRISMSLLSYASVYDPPGRRTRARI